MDLIALAKELGIDVAKFTGEDGKVNELTLEAEVKRVKKENSDDNNNKDDDNKDSDYLKKELEKAIKKRDEAKKDYRSLKEELDELKKSLEAKPDPEEFNKTKAELEELRQFKEELEKEKEAKELEAMSESERQKILWDKQMNEFKSQYDGKLNEFQSKFAEREKELALKEQEIENLRQHQLKSELLIAAKNNKAYNPEQVYRLLERDFKFDKTSQKFIKEVTDRNGKIVDLMDVDEYVKNFLSDEINENLVESDMTAPNRGKTTVPPHQSTKPTLTKEQEVEMEKKYNLKDPVAYLKIKAYEESAFKKGKE